MGSVPLLQPRHQILLIQFSKPGFNLVPLLACFQTTCYSCYTRDYTYPTDNQCYFDSYSPDSFDFKPIWECFGAKMSKMGLFAKAKKTGLNFGDSSRNFPNNI